MHSFKSVVASLLICICCSCSVSLPDEVAASYDTLPDHINFNFHVRPILSDRCFSCHGPDDNARKAELRLDIEFEAKSALQSGNGKAIINGNARNSLMVKRILSSDPEFMMPTPDSHLTLSSREKATLVKWIQQGAKWEKHWAFSAPVQPSVPEEENPIDYFVDQKIESEALIPTEEAQAEQLIRRVSMDLTGLPPTISEIDEFLEDSDSNAYEKVVDRLLSSKAYAERLTMEWLDVSRYADSHGMHADGYRRMWPWRDWVIQAFDQNMPYDQFGTWQIAGDLLPEATHDQKLATAFNRNHTMTAEGGAIDEEFRLAYVFDRTETVMSAFQGLTLNCARCHDHKFDPITQKEYYQLNAFFNNVKELGMTGDDGDYGPMLALAQPIEEKELAELNSQIREKEKHLKLSREDFLSKSSYIDEISENALSRKKVAHASFENVRERNSSDAKINIATDYGEYLPNHIIDNNPKIVSNIQNELVPSNKGNGVQLTGEYDEVYLLSVPNFEKYEPFSASLWLNTTKRDNEKTQMLICTSGEKNNYWRGWEFDLNQNNQLNFRLIHSLPHNYLHVQSEDSINVNEWVHVGFTYDGSEDAAGVKLFINGLEVPSTVEYNNLYKSIHPVAFKRFDDKKEEDFVKSFANPEHAYKKIKRAVRVGKSYRAYTGEYGIFKGVIDEVRIYSGQLSLAEMAKVSGVDKKPIPDNWSGDHYFLRDENVQKSIKELTDLRKRRQELISQIPEIMVMEELEEERAMYIYDRGDYTQPTEIVEPGVPSVLPDFQSDLPTDRLGLARWLFNKENPLTARVTVNRYWQMIFGRGLVSTPGDFGLQGALPSHPELLDWLAVDFMENGWDVKRLLRQIVTSAAYKRSSVVDEKSLELDPENVYLARGASYRFPAEMIRDNALAASGLLVREPGGASVRPYQPEGLWIEKSFFSQILLTYKQDKGEDLYRRSMYTFIRRTAPPPSLTVFDQPNREVCTLKREITNTPLQALVLMNDPQFVEAARVLAERIQLEAGPNLSEQIARAFRLCTGRTPDQSELDIIENLYEEQLALFEEKSENADRLLQLGETLIDDSLEKNKTAALAMVTSAIMNHDETYMKR